MRLSYILLLSLLGVVTADTLPKANVQIKTKNGTITAPTSPSSYANMDSKDFVAPNATFLTPADMHNNIMAYFNKSNIHHSDNLHQILSERHGEDTLIYLHDT